MYENDPNNQSGGNYGYGWNEGQDPNIVYTNEPPKKRNKRFRTAMIVLGFAVIFGLCVFASFGIYSVWGPDGGTQGGGPSGSTSDLFNNDKPKIGIVPIENYYTDEKPVSGEPLTTVQIVEQVRPAIVGIVCDVQFSRYMGQTAGSGVIMTEDGYIVTNQHVIADATNVSVVFEDGTEYTALVIGEDRKTDLAVLKINATGLPYAQFGDSDQLKIGEQVVAIGNPTGMELFGTTTQGIISAINRNVTIEDRSMTLIQTDAAINEGNSGGALINPYGQVIGINSVKVVATGMGSSTEGLGFAIPSNTVVPVVDSLISNGYVRERPLIGISGRDVSDSIANYYDVPQGTLVEQVTPGSGAEEAGILPGDIIVKINGKIVRSISELNAEKDRFKAGDIVTLTIYRDGSTLEVKVRLTEEKPT